MVRWGALAAAVLVCGAAADNRYLVTFKDAPTHRAFSALAVEELAGGTVEVDLRRHHAVAATVSDEGLAILRANPHVESVEPDVKRYEDRMNVNPEELEGGAIGMPYGISMVQADLLEEAEHPSKKLCIIDSGLDMRHPDFANNTKITGSDDPEGAGSWNYDASSHGTHVAGTIAAMRNGEGVVGVNPEGRLQVHIVRVFGRRGWTYSSNLIAAVDTCIEEGSHIVSMSLSGDDRGTIEEKAFAEFYNDGNGVLLVAAAGNKGGTKYSYPASYDSVISVSSVSQTYEHAVFAQKNDQVEVCAPGVDVLSSVAMNHWRSEWETERGDYATFRGTSMATPHVSGVAALVWNRMWYCTAGDVRRALVATSKDLGEEGWDPRFGHGLIQALDAYHALRDYDCVPPARTPVPTPAPTVPTPVPPTPTPPTPPPALLVAPPAGEPVKEDCAAQEVAGGGATTLCNFAVAAAVAVQKVHVRVVFPQLFQGGVFCYRTEITVTHADATWTATLRNGQWAVFDVESAEVVPAGTPLYITVVNENPLCAVEVDGRVAYETMLPTPSPPTPLPPTPLPPTPAPATPAPPTPAPATLAPPTPTPETAVPPTPAPTTAVPLPPVGEKETDECAAQLVPAQGEVAGACIVAGGAAVAVRGVEVRAVMPSLFSGGMFCHSVNVRVVLQGVEYTGRVRHTQSAALAAAGAPAPGPAAVVVANDNRFCNAELAVTVTYVRV
eukprot:TRINITY_DN1422_c0_g2_i1.p1 TRINITY_DN1422_c0_g2~~TRINITY_DN1422_c0_g2_i1.p1  ORF type:complete len:724 (+),score=231.96 TRINITY_DN1422_c0_g2_i1:71-2242(+)